MKLRHSIAAGLSALMVALQVLMPLSQVVAYSADTPASIAAESPPKAATIPSPPTDKTRRVPPQPEAPANAARAAPTAAMATMAFGVGDNNYGQQQRDTDNPENHPGRHFAGPVNLLNGNFFLTVGDFFMPGRGISLQLARSYNSLAAANGEVGDFGPGWTHSYETHVVPGGSGMTITVVEGDGAHNVYVSTGLCPGTSVLCFASPPGLYRQLRLMNDGSYLLFYKNGMAQVFNNDGKLVEIRDRYKNRLLLYYYDGLPGKCPNTGPVGKLCRVDDPTGNLALLFDYITLSFIRISSVTELFERSPTPGRHISYLYNGTGDLIDVIYPEEMVDQANYAYDLQGRMVSYNDPRQPAGARQAQAINYDAQSRVITTTYLANGADNVYVAVRYRSDDIEFLSDPAQAPVGCTEVRDGAGQLSRVEYDVNGNITYEGDYFYDYGWWWGKWWWWHPTYWWLLYRKVDTNDHATLYGYDAWGNTTAVTTALGAVQRYLWEAPYYDTLHTADLKYGNLISTTNSAGLTTHYQYLFTSANNSYNLIETQVLDSGEIIMSHYRSDLYGQLVEQMDPLSRITSYEYDEFGNTTVITDAAGNVTRNFYDDVGRPVMTMDQLGIPTHYTYDEADRLIAVEDVAGGVTAYTYSRDGRDNLLQLVNANGAATTYQYDELDRLTFQSNSLTQTTSYGYDNANRLTRRTDADGRYTLYTYDAKSRMREAEYYDPMALQPYQTNTYRYDGAGNLIWMSNENVTLAYAYDALDQRTRIEMWTPAWGMTRTLDLLRQPATGNLASVMSADGAYHVDYDYDVFNHVQTVSEIAGGDVYSTTYHYDRAGRMTHQNYPPSSGMSGAYLYTPNNHIQRVSYLDPTSAAWTEYAYTYDERGLMTGEVDAGDAYTYTYDMLGRVIETEGSSVGKLGYTYDALGNRLSVTTPATTTKFAYDAHSRLLSAGDATFGYNEMGARVSLERVGPSPDLAATGQLAGGNVVIQSPTGPSSPSQSAYVYDNDMRLTQLQEGGQIFRYLYDPLGNLIGYTGSDGSAHYYLRNGEDVYLELDAAGAVMASYVIGAQGVQSMMRNGARYLLLYDGRGRVRWLVDPATGVIVHRYGPDLFDPGVGLTDFYNPVRMLGAWWFPEVQLIHFGGGVFWDPWFGGFLAKAWPWIYWPFGPFHPWRPIFRFWPWPWPWPRPWGWPWPYPWPYLWSWPGAWVRPWIIWPIWPWSLRFSWPWWYWRWWWGWHWWGHWWCWHPWSWWAKWWWYPWWHPWAWWGYWWWPWWWWASCWWWPGHWWWWIWWQPWGWAWGPGNFWWCWWWWWPRPWWSWPWMWPPILGPPDMGDAPIRYSPGAPFYRAAIHGIWWYEWLGSGSSGEWGSRYANSDRDDGVHADPLAGTLTFTATVAQPLPLERYGPATQIFVHGWVDWERDGDWNAPDELITLWYGYPGDPGGLWAAGQPGLAVTQPFAIPDHAFGAADVIDLWLRYRLDYATNWMSPLGYTRFGEVEDHLLTVARPHRPAWDGGYVGIEDTLVITYAVVVTDVLVSITPAIPITPVWTIAPLTHGPAAPSAPGNVLTLAHAPFANNTVYTLSLSGGATYSGGNPVLPADFSVTAASCIPVTQVALSLLTPLPVYTDDVVTFQADLLPETAAYPITYQITTDGVAGAVQTTLTNSLTFPRTFATPGDHSVEFAAWNCAMLPADAVHDAISLTVLARPTTPVSLTAVNLTLASAGELYTDTVANFTVAFAPNDATRPFSYELQVDGVPVGGVITTTAVLTTWAYTFATPGAHTVTVAAWNAPLLPEDAVHDEVPVTVLPQPTLPMSLTAVNLTLISGGTLYTDTTVVFGVDIDPNGAERPISYVLQVDGVVGGVVTTTLDLFSWEHVFDATGVHTVTIAAWNSLMQPAQAVSDTATVGITPYGVCVPVANAVLTLTTSGDIYTDTIVGFSADILPQNATYPYHYTVDNGPPQTVSQNTVAFTRTYATTGTQTVTFAAWNCAMADPITDSVSFTVLPWPAPPPHFLYLPLTLRNFPSP